MSRKTCFGGPFDKQRGKSVQTFWESKRQCLYHIYWSLWTKLSRETCLLVICKILRPFVNTWTADNKYSLLNRENLTQPIHMPLSQKKETFSELFFPFLKSILNFEHFQEKGQAHSWCISQITDSEKCG